LGPSMKPAPSKRSAAILSFAASCALGFKTPTNGKGIGLDVVQAPKAEPRFMR
jgi:hypothetical protein